MPIGPDRDVMAAQVSRLRVFRATGSDDLASVNRAAMNAADQDVTALFLAELGVRPKSPAGRRPLLFVMGAAVVAGTLALLRLRKSGVAGISPPDVGGSPSRPRVSHV